MSKDTYLGDIYKPNTTNRYAYCSGDPINQMDQNGHFGILTAIGLAVTAVIILATVTKSSTDKPTTEKAKTKPVPDGGYIPKGNPNNGNKDIFKNNNTGNIKPYTGGTINLYINDSGQSYSYNDYYYSSPDPKQYYYSLINEP